MLTRRPSIVSVEAETAVEAIRLTPKQLRILFTRRPQLGEKFWRSYQRRRALLLKSNFRGLTVYGKKGDKATLDTVELLFDFLTRCRLPGTDPLAAYLDCFRIADCSPRILRFRHGPSKAEGTHRSRVYIDEERYDVD